MKIDLNKFSEIWNKWFLLYLLLIILFLWLFKSNLSKTLNICSLFILIIIQLMYNLKVKYEQKVFAYLNWFLFVILSLFGIAYSAFAVTELFIALFVILIIFLVTLLFALIINIVNLWRSKDAQKPFIFTIINYLALAFTAVVFFGFLFSLSAGFPDSGIQLVNIQKDAVMRDYVYFSATTFYSGSLGDMYPLGHSKIIMIAELAFSYIIHIIILGIIIANYKRQEQNLSQKEKE